MFSLQQRIYDVTEQNYNEGVSPLTDFIGKAETARKWVQSQLIEALLKVNNRKLSHKSQRWHQIFIKLNSNIILIQEL